MKYHNSSILPRRYMFSKRSVSGFEISINITIFYAK